MGRPSWTWDAQREEAAALVAVGAKKQAEIAISLDPPISLRTLQNWIADPDFQKRVLEHRKTVSEDANGLAIASQYKRLWRQQNDQEAFEQVRIERAQYWTKRRSYYEKMTEKIRNGRLDDELSPQEHLAIDHIEDDPSFYPGITTGRILYRNDPKKGHLFETDEAVSKLLLDIDQSVAKELGQVKETLDLTTDGQPISSAAINLFAATKSLPKDNQKAIEDVLRKIADNNT